VVIVVDVSGGDTFDEANALRKASVAKKTFSLSDRDAAGIASMFLGVSKNRIYKRLLEEKENK